MFYPLSAVVNLFCGILLDPADEQTQDDMRLIQSVPELARMMRLRCITPQDEQYLESLDGFVNELLRLASCAVARVNK